MQDDSPDYLTTRELADLLRIGERKVYDLAARGEVPCVRALGKLLFPRAEILRWLAASRSGPSAEGPALPNVIVGSHDPMLDWALRESASGLAAFLDGSHDGLTRFLAREAIACGLHVHEAAGWNVATVRERAADLPVVLIRFATRRRGLIVEQGNLQRIEGISGLAGRRVAHRQASAASQTLFEDLARRQGVALEQPRETEAPARTEDELALRVFEGRADAAFGLESVARQYRLDFVPVLEEEFDLLVWRRAWFDAPFQALLGFFRESGFSARAADVGGYDFSRLGMVRFNGNAG